MSIISNQGGINLTSSKLQLIEISWLDDSVVLENADEELLAAPFNKNLSEQEIISLIRDSYYKLKSRKPAGAKNISFTLPGGLFEIIELPVDDLLTKEDLNAHLNWEFSVLYPHKDPGDFILRYFEIGEYPYPNAKKILVAAIEKKILSAIHKFCKTNNLFLRLVDNAHFASNLLINPEPGQNNYVSLYSDDDKMSMMIFERGKPKFYKSFPCTEMNSIPARIKSEYQDYYVSQNRISEIESIYAAGDSFTDEVMPLFNSAFQYGIIRILPFSNLKASPKLFNKGAIVSKFYSYAAPIGIAARIS